MALAARGARLTTRKLEKIEDLKELWQVRKQAIQVVAKGTLVGVGLTLLILLIP